MKCRPKMQGCSFSVRQCRPVVGTRIARLVREGEGGNRPRRERCQSRVGELSGTLGQGGRVFLGATASSAAFRRPGKLPGKQKASLRSGQGDLGGGQEAAKTA